MKRILIGFGITFLVILGCAKPENFLYLHPSPIALSKTQLIRQVVGNGKIDMLWDVGAMTEQLINFQSGVNQFMTTFVSKKYDWRMAVIPDNTFEAPYLGMVGLFDLTAPNAVGTLVSSVVQVVRNGQDGEKMFDPAVQNLSNYGGTFLRSDATLVIIMTNDAPDESSITTTSSQMQQFLAGLKGNDPSKVIVYGVFGATDLGCDPNTIDTNWNYHGTEFENLVNATNGKTFSLCNASFGAQLSKIGDDLYQRLDHPRIVLDKKAEPASIHVLYHGQDLPGGAEANGGVWYFDVATNAVVFYSLNFAQNDTESVTVTYVQDTGVI